MSITAELFWSNLNRWQKYHGFTRSDLERQINYRIEDFRKKRFNPASESD